MVQITERKSSMFPLVTVRKEIRDNLTLYEAEQVLVLRKPSAHFDRRAQAQIARRHKVLEVFWDFPFGLENEGR